MPVIALVGFFLCRRRKQSKKNNRQDEDKDEDGICLSLRDPQNANGFRDSKSYPPKMRDEREAFFSRLSISSTPPPSGLQDCVRVSQEKQNQ